MSDEHFSVDGTLIQAWASHKSFRPKGSAGQDDPPSGSEGGGGLAGRNAERDWKGEPRSNQTHANRTEAVGPAAARRPADHAGRGQGL